MKKLFNLKRTCMIKIFNWRNIFQYIFGHLSEDMILIWGTTLLISSYCTYTQAETKISQKDYNTIRSPHPLSVLYLYIIHVTIFIDTFFHYAGRKTNLKPYKHLEIPK